MKARQIIRNALTFHLNRLSPGEYEDADLFGRCLDALNDVVDEFNGVKSQLFQEVLTDSVPITGTYGVLGIDWATVDPGSEILGATFKQPGVQDISLSPLTMAQYAYISLKTITDLPQYFAPDGLSKVFLYPQVTAITVTIRTKAPFQDFTDLDTDYAVPKGFRSAFSAMVARRMAGALLGAIPPAVELAARAASIRLAAQAISPAIITTSPVRGNIIIGWR